MYRHQSINKAITYSCIGFGLSVFAAWNYSESGITYKVWDRIRGGRDSPVRKLGIDLPSPKSVGRVLLKRFILTATDTKNYLTWIGSSFSHKEPFHALFNFVTWSSFAHVLYALPPVHTVALIFGSALAASASWLAHEKDKPFRDRRQALGSSGIVSGILTVATMFAPTNPAYIFGIIKMPLFVATGAYFLMDTYFMSTGAETGIGHSAHIGGSVFGFIYYAVFLRRYGGLLKF